MGPSLQNISTGGIQLGVQFAEGIVYWRSTENPDALALSLLNLKPLRLKNDAQTFYEEDAAKDGEQQFLVYDDGTNTDDATNGQRTCVSHKHLCRIGIIPQETYHGTHEGTEEHNQFLCVGDIHNVEVGGIDNMTADVGKNQQCNSDDKSILQLLCICHRMT